MIKFNCIIHKETGTVIKYEHWLQQLKSNGFISFYGNLSDGCHHRKPEEMLFDDDFEIIYDYEFTLEELGIIFRSNQKFNDELMKKIYESMSDKEYLKAKYKVKV